MLRWGLFATAVVVAAVAVTTASGANGKLRATFTRPIPVNKLPGEYVRLAWKLRDSAGHPVSLRRVFVTIVCPTGDSTTTTPARATAPGLYSANATVPPGGIGTVTIGANGTRVGITNPFHR